jgi:hypothetical protein
MDQFPHSSGEGLNCSPGPPLGPACPLCDGWRKMLHLFSILRQPSPSGAR